MEIRPKSAVSPHLRHRAAVLLLTFLAYASFHASRKPPSIVKPVLGPGSGPGPSPAHGWPPFSGPSGNHRLGELDLAFLSSYSLAMFFSGHAADRLPLRLFLFSSMLASGLTTLAFGLAFFLNIHRFSFFLAVQILAGAVQSAGWPCVVAVVGNWFGRSKKGLVMGIWNSHTSAGNILGSVIASAVLDFGWGWSFVVPGLLIVAVGFLILGFLVESPGELGFEAVEVEMEGVTAPEDGGAAAEEVAGDDGGRVGFLEAWRLPRVAPYAFSLFFAKLVAYTFLYWLPFYIRNTAVGGKQLSNKMAGILSTVFDLGGVAGGITAGFIADKTEAQASTSLAFLFLSIPALIFYRAFGSVSSVVNLVLLFLSGFFVNGPYSLITTAVAADLGGDSKALATVTAIIDGTGSIGAALGPLLTGYISTRGWNNVFLMLILAISFASLFLIHIARAELSKK